MEEALDACQLNFSIENCGRFFKTSKKRVSWVFSLGDQRHTVVFVWSKLSDKQTVQVDEKEEWFGTQKVASVFSHKWITDEGLKLHILACSRTPNREPKDFSKYELMIHSRAFTSLPFSDGNFPLNAQSIANILYPDGYHFDDEKYAASKLKPSAADEYQANEDLRQMVTARRIVRHDGTPR
jgi:hypothetical protein